MIQRSSTVLEEDVRARGMHTFKNFIFHERERDREKKRERERRKRRNEIPYRSTTG